MKKGDRLLKTKPYSYEADWRQYAFPPQTCGFADEEVLARKYTSVTLEKDTAL